MESKPQFWAATWNKAAILIAVCLLTGCGTNRSPYPEAKVKTALGTARTCAFCKQAIPLVKQENMVTAQGVAYVICDAQCAVKLKEWAKNQ